MTKEEAIRWMEDEKSSFEHAPALNGCQMTKEWKDAIDVYSMAIAALRQQEQESNDHLTLDELRKMVGEPAWIRVEDKLPDVGQRVLCIDEAGTVHMATGWIDWPDKTVYFCVPDLHCWLQSSYWLPLPEALEKRPGTECCPNQNIEPAWKRQFMRTFLGGR